MDRNRSWFESKIDGKIYCKERPGYERAVKREEKFERFWRKHYTDLVGGTYESRMAYRAERFLEYEKKSFLSKAAWLTKEWIGDHDYIIIPFLVFSVGMGILIGPVAYGAYKDKHQQRQKLEQRLKEAQLSTNEVFVVSQTGRPADSISNCRSDGAKNTPSAITQSNDVVKTFFFLNRLQNTR